MRYGNLLYQQILSQRSTGRNRLSAIEDAMVVAARVQDRRDLRGKFNSNRSSGRFSVRPWSKKLPIRREISIADARRKNPAAEVGSEILTNKPTDVLGRIAAQTAKQVILQKVREAERDTIFNEYHNRVGELVTVIVKRAEGPDLIVDMGRTEARLPKREQSKLETYNIGERLRVVIRMVDRAAKARKYLSRGCRAGAASV
jgi:N utilization substance protein A